MNLKIIYIYNFMDICINFHQTDDSSDLRQHINNFKKDIINDIYMLKYIKRKYRPFYQIFFNNINISNKQTFIVSFQSFNKFIKDNLPEFYVYNKTIFLEKYCNVCLDKYIDITNGNKYTDKYAESETYIDAHINTDID